jgi:hypothetical protein
VPSGTGGLADTGATPWWYAAAAAGLLLLVGGATRLGLVATRPARARR